MRKITINGGCGKIDALYSRQDDSNAPIALVLPPHPQIGGTMNNRVTRTAHYALEDSGFSVMRFDYRKNFSDGIGEVDDAMDALDHLVAMHGMGAQCIVAGYEFGAWIGMQVMMRRPEVSGFISIAPPVDIYDFDFLSPCLTSGMVINGDSDRVTSPDAICRFVERLGKNDSVRISHERIMGADHFFSNDGALCELNASIAKYARQTMIVEHTMVRQ